MTAPEALRGHRKRTIEATLAELQPALAWLGQLAERGIEAADLPGIARTCEGIRRLTAEAGAGGAE